MTRAIDIDCPKGHAPAGQVCNGFGVGVDLCQARINEAGAITRQRNQQRRDHHKRR